MQKLNNSQIHNSIELFKNKALPKWSFIVIVFAAIIIIGGLVAYRYSPLFLYRHEEKLEEKEKIFVGSFRKPEQSFVASISEKPARIAAKEEIKREALEEAKKWPGASIGPTQETVPDIIIPPIDGERWKTYKNTEAGYAIDYPAEWIVMRRRFSNCGKNCEPIEDLLIQNMPYVSFPGNGPEDGSVFGITILELSSPSPLTIRNWIMSSDIPEREKQKRLDSIETMEVADAEREVLPGRVDWQGNVWFVDGNRLYKLGYFSGSTEQFNKDTTIFQKMLSSFRFIEKPEGWPIKIEGYYGTQSIIPIHTTGDEKLELVTILHESESLGWESELFIWDIDGHRINWQHPFTTGIAGTPSIGDIDKDGKEETVVGAFENGKQSYLYILNGNGSEVIKSISVGGNARLGTPTLDDIDNDGKDEIIIGELSWLTSEIGNNIYVFNDNGGLVKSWPTDGKGIYGKIAVGDLDNSGKKEIVAFSLSGKLYVWHSDGTPMEGHWPYTIDVGTSGGRGGFCSPILADLNNDGNLEIILGTEQNEVYVFNYDGTLFDGDNDGVAEWPKEIKGMVFDSVAVGDINNDNSPDIVVGTLRAEEDGRARIYAWDNKGKLLTNWPVAIEPEENETSQVNCPVALGDISGDGKVNIIAQVQFYNYINHTLREAVYAWDNNGGLISGWPKDLTGASFQGSPSLADIDLDGDVEVIAASEHYPDSFIYVWDLEAPYNASTMHWPMAHHDPQHTGLYIKP